MLEPGPPGEMQKEVGTTSKSVLFLRGCLLGCNAKEVLENYCFSSGTHVPLSIPEQQSLQRDWKGCPRILRGTCTLRKDHRNPQTQAQEGVEARGMTHALSCLPLLNLTKKKKSLQEKRPRENLDKECKTHCTASNRQQHLKHVLQVLQLLTSDFFFF